MLSPKPWKLDSVARLLACALICFFIGTLVIAVLHFAQTHGKAAWKFYPLVAVSFGLSCVALVLIRKEWNLDNFMKRTAFFLASVYAALFLGVWAQDIAWPVKPDVASSGQMLITILSFQGAILIFVFMFLREHKVGWVEGFGLNHEVLKSVLIGILATCIFLPVGRQLQICSGDAIEWLGRHYHSILRSLPLKPEEQLPVQTLRGETSWCMRAALGVFIVLVVPVAEETLFRGILYPWIKRRGYPRLALLGTALLFGLMHLNAAAFLPLFALALLLTALYEWTDNLLAPVAAHAVFNGLNFALLYLIETHPLGK